jgi:ABC-type phosphate transport system substrate-binding protein
MKRLCTLLALIAASVVVVGCGSSGGGSSSSSTSSPAATQAVTTSTSVPSGSGSGTVPNTAALGSATLAQAVQLCKEAVSKEQGLSDSLKGKLNNICNQAGSGNKIAVKQAAHDVCVEIIKSKVPVAEQQAAEASCPAA